MSLQWGSWLGTLHQIFAIYIVYSNTEGLMSALDVRVKGGRISPPRSFYGCHRVAAAGRPAGAAGGPHGRWGWRGWGSLTSPTACKYITNAPAISNKFVTIQPYKMYGVKKSGCLTHVIASTKFQLCLNSRCQLE